MTNLTILGSIAKAQRGIALLQIPQAAAEHLRAAVDAFKSAAALAKAQHTVQIELEGELPAPGPALFDEAGTPTPAAALAPVTTDDVVLSMTFEEFDRMAWIDQSNTEEDIWFAVRSHMRARQFPIEDFRTLKELVNEVLSGLTEKGTFEWLIDQVKTSGDFNWPRLCEKCADACGTEETLCSPCDRERRNQIYKDEQAAKKAAIKAAKPKAPKKAKANPLEVEPTTDLEESA